MREHPGVLGAEKNPHETGSEKGDVKIKRRVGRPQIIEKAGSPHWTISATG
jgi:hypothetical protein